MSKCDRIADRISQLYEQTILSLSNSCTPHLLLDMRGILLEYYISSLVESRDFSFARSGELGTSTTLGVSKVGLPMQNEDV